MTVSPTPLFVGPVLSVAAGLLLHSGCKAGWFCEALPGSEVITHDQEVFPLYLRSQLTTQVAKLRVSKQAIRMFGNLCMRFPKLRSD